MATSFNADIPNIKLEHAAGPTIKHDPDLPGASPSAQSEDDIYEDAGDLDFSEAGQQLYLARIPKFLWECWSKLDDNAEIQVGRIRIEGQAGNVKRMSLMLNQSGPYESLPKEYNMHVANHNTPNTFIFSEQDLPGYRQFEAESAPLHWLNRKRVEKKRGAARPRRSIPKKTALRGQIQTEVNCQPVDNQEYNQFTTNQAELSFRPRPKVLDAASGSNLLAPGTIGTGSNYSDFISSKTGAAARKKGQTLKATRMARNDLLDLLFDLFKEYTYWPFTALKNRTQQPDAYLKEILDEIAFMPKSGNHVSQWQLKNGYKMDRYGTVIDAANGVAPDPGTMGSFDGAEELEDESFDMEDVPMG